MFDHELTLTDAQERQRKRIERRIKTALRELLELASEAGAVDPHLYYECCGSLCVFDYDRGDPGVGHAGERQNKVCLSVDITGPGVPQLDCGAW